MNRSLPVLRLSPIGPRWKRHMCIPGIRSFNSAKRFVYDTPEEEHLVRVFDDQKYFNNFNKSQNHGLFSNSTPSTGLFRNELLKTPHGLVEFSKQSLVDVKHLVRTMNKQAEAGQQGQLTYIKKLDQLSDILCRVIDVAEFIRVAHPSQTWINAAQQTHEIMFEYMNQLNTNTELHKHLLTILNSKELLQKLSHEEVEVGKYLKDDFERSGINMDPYTRDNFVAITQQISLLGSQFNNEIHTLDKFWCEITKEEFNLIESSSLRREIKQTQSYLTSQYLVPLSGHIPYTILLQCRQESLRKKVWIALHNASSEQIKTLNEFVKYRALLSKMLGYKSFAHYQLEHKMAKNPENVMTFLKNLQQSLKSKKNGVVDEIRSLYQFKEGFDPDADDDTVLDQVKPWDRDYLLNKRQQGKDVAADNISDYLSVGTIVSGLNKLFKSIYNLELVPEPTLKGETWDHYQVRKIKVFDHTTKTKLGYLYLDFWSPKVLPSHFTIVCSRKLNTDINTETKKEMDRLVHLDESKEHQLPVISLICNFNKPSDLSIGRFAGIEVEKPTLLSLDQVDTIFHEMGHAMHSMIGKTNLHNLSGTRCLTDFVELPSVLMEFFSRDPRVICKIARNYQTGEYLPVEMLRKHQTQRVVLDQCETYMQSKMAMLDQVLHDEDMVEMLQNEAMFEKFDSTQVYHELEKQLQVFADQWSTWHGKFPHLFSYGAVYYSYLLDRAIADKIWHGLFNEDPWSRHAGEMYKNSILKWGGTRDPWECLADALKNSDLRNGDSRAMQTIATNM